MASFDFAPLTLRYAQDEREIAHARYSQDKRLLDHFPFVLSVAERQRSEVEGRKLRLTRHTFPITA